MIKLHNFLAPIGIACLALISTSVMAQDIPTPTSQSDRAVEVADAHNDGVASQIGGSLLSAWKVHPNTAGKLAAITPSKSYMAKQLKLAAGAYSVADMAIIANAKGQKHPSALNMKMQEIEGQLPNQRSHVSPGEDALARSVGVDASDYSLVELARMKFAADF